MYNNKNNSSLIYFLDIDTIKAKYNFCFIRVNIRELNGVSSTIYLSYICWAYSPCYTKPSLFERSTYIIYTV